MKRKISHIVLAVALSLLFAFIFGATMSGCNDDGPTMGRNLFLFNPYRNVNFDTAYRLSSDLHVHTLNSDGILSPQETVRRFSNAGFDFLAIADHDYWQYGRYPYGQPHQNNRYRTITYPWSNFGVTNNYGLTAIQATEFSRMHHMNAFFTDYTETLNQFGSRAARDEFELLANALVHSNGVARFMLNHPQRHIIEAMSGSNNRENRMAWLNSDNENVRYTAMWYARLLEEFDEILSIEVYNQGMRYEDDVMHWDRIIQESMGHNMRPVWLTANSDCHGSHYGTAKNVMLASTNNLQGFQSAWQQGAFFATAFGNFDPRTLEVEGNLGDRWNYVPVINDIQVDYRMGDITIDTDTYTSIEWVTADMQVVATGNTVNFRYNTKIRYFVRAVVTNKNSAGEAIARTYTQPFGVGIQDQNSWYFRFTGFNAYIPRL